MSTESFLQLDDQFQRLSDRQTFLKLARFAKPWRWSYIVGFGLLFASSLCAVASARFLGQLVDEAFLEKNTSLAWRYGALLLFAEIAAVLASFVGRYILSTVSSRTILLIRTTLFKHIHDLPMSYFDRQPLGRTVTRLTHDVEGLENFFSGSMGRLATSAILVVVTMVAMLIGDPLYGLLMIASILPAIVITVYSRTSVRQLNWEMMKKNSAINSRLAEYLNGIPIIRSFALEKWSKHTFDDSVSEHLRASIKLNRYYAWTRPLISLLCMVPLLVLFIIGGRSVLSGTLALGFFITFIRYCERFSNPIIQLSREVHVVQTAFTSADRIAGFLMSPKEEEQLGINGTTMATGIKGHLSFENVSMSYNGSDPVLQGISFDVLPGERVGLAGRTGSGKTTTVSLIARLYPYQAGRILIDSLPLEDFERDSLRSVLGFVAQDVIIFKGSVKENLSLGQDYSNDRIKSACLSTGLLNVLDKRGLGLKDILLDKGSNISVGERQLIALTRILLKNPAILVLDEATANIDPAFEAIVHQAVDKVMKGRTCLIVAHRLDTLKGCDRLLVFKNGQIVEQGHHDTLLALDGYYRQLFEEHQAKNSDAPNYTCENSFHPAEPPK